MPEVFADTGYWIALQSPGDEWHDVAQEVNERLRGITIVTSEMVLVEFLNYFSGSGPAGRRRAVNVVRRIWSDEDIVVIPQTGERFRSAFQRYSRRLDQGWSVTDCASFIIMEELKIIEALAHDRHFVQAGFIALMRRGQL